MVVERQSAPLIPHPFQEVQEEAGLLEIARLGGILDQEVESDPAILERRESGEYRFEKRAIRDRPRLRRAQGSKGGFMGDEVEELTVDNEHILNINGLLLEKVDIVEDWDHTLVYKCRKLRVDHSE